MSVPASPHTRPSAHVEQTVVGYGVRVTLRATEPDALDILLARLPGRWRPSANGRADRVYSLEVDRSARRPYALYSDDLEIVRSSDLERILESVVAKVGFCFAENARRHTFIHAGAVAWQGHAILLPGRQASGKTTLTAALVRAGATYLSDDYAAIDDRGRVHPFPKLLSIRQGKRVRSRLESVESLGGVQETRMLPVGLVVFAPHTGVLRWRPRRVPPGKGVLELLAHTVSAQTRPRQALERLGRVVKAAPVLKGGRGEADDTAGLILRRLDAALGAV